MAQHTEETVREIKDADDRFAESRKDKSEEDRARSPSGNLEVQETFR